MCYTKHLKISLPLRHNTIVVLLLKEIEKHTQKLQAIFRFRLFVTLISLDIH